jgi:hypothetical protein
MAVPNISKRSFSGARCKISLDGKVIGWATGVEIDETIQQVRVDVLDDPYTQEIETVGIVVSGRIAQVNMYGNTLAEDAQGKKYPQGSKIDVLLHPAVTLTIVDSIEGKVLFEVYGMKFSGRSHNVDRMSVMMTNLSFQAIRMESKAQTPTV